MSVAHWIENTTLDRINTLAMLDMEILDKAELAYEYSLNPPGLDEWDAYVAAARTRTDLYVLEAVREAVRNGAY